MICDEHWWGRGRKRKRRRGEKERSHISDCSASDAACRGTRQIKASTHTIFLKLLKGVPPSPGLTPGLPEPAGPAPGSLIPSEKPSVLPLRAATLASDPPLLPAPIPLSVRPGPMRRRPAMPPAPMRGATGGPVAVVRPGIAGAPPAGGARKVREGEEDVGTAEEEEGEAAEAAGDGVAARDPEVICAIARVSSSYAQAHNGLHEGHRQPA